MCGIAGVFGTLDRPLLEAMVERLKHRGPDGQGVVELGHAGLGSTRLSLIDQEGGHQPMTSGDGRLRLVHNGEIYNHPELRRRLEREGHRFAGRCDTEVLLRAFEAWGRGCLAEIEGMYAFAVTDGERLTLARDPFGIKPLYYAVTDGGRRLLFASEIKALLADPALPRTLDRAALFELTVFRHVLGEKTYFSAIRQVPPGSTLTVTRGPDGALRIEGERHGAPRPVPLPEDEDDLAALVLERLTASVRAQLFADHPVGAFLSGGLDSSLVTALMVRESARPVHTFTVADSPANPDVQVSRALAAALGTEHHEIALSTEQILADLPSITARIEGPTAVTLVENASPSIRRHVKAVLCGEGADELFAGYPTHAEPHRWVQVYASAYNEMIRSGGVLTSDCADAKAALAGLTAGGPEALRENMYRFMLGDQLTFLHLLSWDHGGMAHSLEVRVPYLDTRLRDVALALPWSSRIQGRVQKAVLRKAAARVLPAGVAETILNRRKVAAPAALHSTYKALEERSRELVPEDLGVRHPYHALCTSPWQKLRLDLFIYVFVGHGGTVPDGFDWRALYTVHRGELLAALSASSAGTEWS
jgi:asparagine synthase (glutamine-hydrolysing)